jgi:hypothetical protein
MKAACNPHCSTHRLMRTLFLVFGALVLSGCCIAPKQAALETDVSALVKPGMQLNDAVASLSTAGFSCDSRAMAPHSLCGRSSAPPCIRPFGCIEHVQLMSEALADSVSSIRAFISCVSL